MTTEIPVAIEGKATDDGRYIVPDALALPIGAVPVTGPGPTGLNAPIGKALGFRREDGVIYATIDLVDGDLPDNYTPTIDIDDVQVNTDDSEQMVVEAGRLRVIHMTPDGENAWPELNRRSVASEFPDEEPTEPPAYEGDGDPA